MTHALRTWPLLQRSLLQLFDTAMCKVDKSRGSITCMTVIVWTGHWPRTWSMGLLVVSCPLRIGHRTTRCMEIALLVHSHMECIYTVAAQQCTRDMGFSVACCCIVAASANRNLWLAVVDIGVLRPVACSESAQHLLEKIASTCTSHTGRTRGSCLCRSHQMFFKIYI